MKFIKTFLVAFLLFYFSNSNAQISVNFTIGQPPVWAPENHENVDYYYLPDVQSYYDVRLSEFIFYSNGRWEHSRNLPSRYRNYNFQQGRTVLIRDYHGSAPYNNYKNHKRLYNNDREDYRKPNFENQKKITNSRNKGKRHKKD